MFDSLFLILSATVHPLAIRCFTNNVEVVFSSEESGELVHSFSW
jgi:hypothetical protein